MGGGGGGGRWGEGQGRSRVNVSPVTIVPEQNHISFFSFRFLTKIRLGSRAFQNE